MHFWGYDNSTPIPPPHIHLLRYTRDEKMATWPSDNPKEIESIVSHFLVYPVRSPLSFPSALLTFFFILQYTSGKPNVCPWSS